MRRTLSRCLANWIASEHEVVVLPTPPLPPTKIHLSDSAREKEGAQQLNRLDRGRVGGCVGLN